VTDEEINRAVAVAMGWKVAEGMPSGWYTFGTVTKWVNDDFCRGAECRGAQEEAAEG
jgi:hypothetical protein